MDLISNVATGASAASIARDSLTVSPASRLIQADDARVPEVVTRGSDSVDISALARRLGLITSEQSTAKPFRAELVERIKDQIEAGTYDTDDKLEIALDRLTRDLDVTG